jgi:uncharacterized membrane protein YsdA (DUF1294 family)
LVLQIALTEYLSSASTVFIAFLLLINVISFSVFAVDKQKAVQGKWRIPEKVLILLAGMGGAAGALLAMKIFRHKTRHPKFSIGIPVLLILQIIVALIVILLCL